MVAASSYQKDGRAAPARLIAAARTPTTSGSNAPLRCRDSRVSERLTARYVARRGAAPLAVAHVQVPKPVGTLAARVVGVAPVVVLELDVRAVGEASGLISPPKASKPAAINVLMWIFPLRIGDATIAIYQGARSGNDLLS